MQNLSEKERIMDMAGCYAILAIHVQTSDKLHTCCVMLSLHTSRVPMCVGHVSDGHGLHTRTNTPTPRE